MRTPGEHGRAWGCPKRSERMRAERGRSPSKDLKGDPRTGMLGEVQNV
jgi:hypothetical protein